MVDSSSLAAASERSGGGFSENRGAKQPFDQQPHVSGSGSGNGPASSLEAQQSYGGAAPTYVLGQKMRDPAGPHGKNLKEGGFEGSGPGDSITAEPGSERDPARVAEGEMGLARNRVGREAGPRQGGLEGGHPYEVLENERSA